MTSRTLGLRSTRPIPPVGGRKWEDAKPLALEPLRPSRLKIHQTSIAQKTNLKTLSAAFDSFLNSVTMMCRARIVRGRIAGVE
eukprot:694796-Prymnesium_polylepis.1